MLGLSPTKGLLRRAAVKKQKKRKVYAFRRQLNEKPSIIPGCPGAIKKQWNGDEATYLTQLQLCMIAKPVGLVDRIEMRKTDCFGKTRLVPHVPSSS